ncbi:MAG: zinc metallopeptidase [Oscillospiraceae bacterium]|nr:zinc metallopeptidase [Oscillospiraceae bacterium]
MPTGTEFYIILILPALIFSVWASFNVNHTFNKYSKISNSRGITAENAVYAVLDNNHIGGISLERINGNLTDHYDPAKNTIRLSQNVSGSTSISAIGVAAHEAGHAVQYGTGYSLIKLRTMIIPVCQFGSNAAMPLVFIGLFFSIPVFVDLGILFFGAAVVFQLVTLPVEFNASHRAVTALRETGTLTGTELIGAEKVLKAAALTYVAALAVALLNFLRLLSLAGRRRR